MHYIERFSNGIIESPFLLQESDITDCFFEEGAKIYREARLKNCTIHNRVSIGNYTHMASCTIGARTEIARRCIISYADIGEGCLIGKSTVINNFEIGSYCAISLNITIGGGQHPMHSLMMVNRKFLFDGDDSINGLDPVLHTRGKIGSDVWVGAGASIMTGVHIGDGAVVGANAVVTKDVPPYTIVAGVPAKEIKKRFSDEIITELLKIRWWEFSKEDLQPYHDCFVDELTFEKLEKLKNLMNCGRKNQYLVK